MKLALNSDWPNREVGRFAGNHLDLHVVKEIGSRPKATLLIVSDKYELLDVLQLKNRRVQNESTDQDLLSIERFNLSGEQRAIELGVFFNLEFKVIKRQVENSVGPRGRPWTNFHRGRRHTCVGLCAVLAL